MQYPNRKVLDSGGYQNQAGAGSKTPSGGTGAGGSNATAGNVPNVQTKSPVTLKDKYNQRQAQTKNRVNKVYDTQYAAQKNSLKTEYDKNLSEAQAALGQIAPQYQQQANNLAVSYERAKRNMNMSAMNSGLSTGTQQQQQLAYNNNWLNSYGALRSEEAGAINKAQQGIADLKTTYNNNLVEARNKINAQRDNALIEASNKDRDWYEKQNQILMQNGDFSAAADIYGKAQAKKMRDTWIAQNPELAVRRGMITKKDYKKITGNDYKYTSQYKK